MRYFLITYKTIKDGNEHSLKVTVSRPTGDIGIDAKSALGLFIVARGSLKKNDIISIQEQDKEGKDIGLPILPDNNEEPQFAPLKKGR